MNKNNSKNVEQVLKQEKNIESYYSKDLLQDLKKYTPSWRIWKKY